MAKSKVVRLLECGCCGQFHPDGPLLPGGSANYLNDCRNNANRFNSDDDFTARTGKPCIEVSLDEQKDEEPLTAVVFRTFVGGDGGDVIALFPYIQGSPGYCDSYQHVGQHGSANYYGLVGGGWNRRTRPAKPEEYAGLKKELESEPYGYRLKVVKRVNYEMHRRAVTAR